ADPSTFRLAPGVQQVKVSGGECCGNAKYCNERSTRLAATPVRAGFRAVAAELHRAPCPRPVRRLVVERPAAVPARLQARPRAVDHRAERALADRVGRSGDGGEPYAAGPVELHAEPGGGLVEHLDGAVLERERVVREREGAERLAQRPRPLQLVVQVVLREP